MNSKNIRNDAAAAAGGGRPPENVSLARQPSVYSLTLEEFMGSMGSSGKDFGSMNMDELLKNIWTAEELQIMADQQGMSTVMGTGTGTGTPAGHLQRQGSLTLPRTLSQKTVDEVWKDVSKDYGTGSGTGTGMGTGGTNVSQAKRQPTFGEVTLEEFLARAGVVREDAQLGGNQNGGVFGDIGSMGFQFQQLNKENNDPLPLPLPMAFNSHNHSNLPLNVNGVQSNQPKVQNSKLPLQHQHQHQFQHQILPKQPAMTYATQIGDQGIRGGIGGGIGMVGLAPQAGTGGVVHHHVSTGSPDEIGKSSGDTSSVSPVPYVFNGGLRGRRSGGAVEKVIERRQRRMIKNRESAARSRARKQAYTMELEAEVAKLKEENEELQKKQAEIVEIQKNQVKEMINLQRGAKKRCLRRTLTGPW